MFAQTAQAVVAIGTRCEVLIAELCRNVEQFEESWVLNDKRGSFQLQRRHAPSMSFRHRGQFAAAVLQRLAMELNQTQQNLELASPLSGNIQLQVALAQDALLAMSTEKNSAAYLADRGIP